MTARGTDHTGGAEESQKLLVLPNPRKVTSGQKLCKSKLKFTWKFLMIHLQKILLSRCGACHCIVLVSWMGRLVVWICRRGGRWSWDLLFGDLDVFEGWLVTKASTVAWVQGRGALSG
eukprot:s3371_g3.t1